jgi:lipopolysaccharide heptosyltransferase II
MTVKTMRLIDRFLGIPLCWILGILSHTAGRRASPAEPWKAILVIKFFGLGSVLLSTPFLSLLRQRFPDAKILYLTFASNKELLDRLPQPSERLTISTSSVKEFLLDTVRAMRTIRREAVQVVFDLEFFSKFSTLMSFLSGARTRVGYALPTRWRRWNLTHPVELDQSAHVTQSFLKQLAPFGIDIPLSPSITQLTATLEETASMERKLDLGTNGVSIVCVNINAGATSLERRWEPDRFTDVLSSYLMNHRATRFFFIGSNDEREYVERALANSQGVRSHALNCAGLLSLGELIALFYRSEFLVTNDSGPMHIASACGTRVVALFGPESPQFYGPTGPASVIYKSLECSPCLNMYNAKLFVCPFNAKCMRSISSTEVLSAMENITTAPHVDAD